MTMTEPDETSGGINREPGTCDINGEPARFFLPVEEELGWPGGRDYWRGAISGPSGAGKSNLASLLLSQIAHRGRSGELPAVPLPGVLRLEIKGPDAPAEGEQS
jgi:hypothetical protein